MLTATALEPKTSVFLTAGWRQLAMLNFQIDPRILAPLIPIGTELDLWKGNAYVSIVGFQFVDARLLGISLPFHQRFEEVNLRFYVVRQSPSGLRRGVVFLREICPKWLVSAVACWWYNEKYITLPMRHRVDVNHVEYEWHHAGRWNGLAVSVHGEPQPLTPGSEEEFIAEHYWGYTKQRDGSTMEYEVEHPAWKVSPASIIRFDCDVEAIYGSPFVPFLREPASVFVADGSPVVVRRGRRLVTDAQTPR